jgi:hypothetical protein
MVLDGVGQAAVARAMNIHRDSVRLILRAHGISAKDERIRQWEKHRDGDEVDERGSAAER